uniref:Permuted single zf-CXXC unit domain-containing protein n=1 Tax=Oryza meridionalis TaxID=40149 RepID=A0A0E0C1Q4_9ORYZ
MEGQWLHEPHGINLCFSISSMQPRMNPSIETGTRNVTHLPFDNVSTSSSQARKTIVQKHKRKTHRPKVIKEGKVAAHKSTTSEPPKEKGKPASKRKYVRRKEQNTTPTEHHPPSKDAVAHTIVVPTLAKRCFNFDGRDHHEENVDLLSQTRVEETPTCYGDAQLLTSAIEGSNIQLVQPWCGIDNPISASVDPMANMRQIWAESSRENRFQKIQPCLLGIPEEPGWQEIFNHEASTRVVNPMPQGYRVPQSPSVPPTCSERNTMNINLSEFPAKNDQSKFATNPNDQIGASFGLCDSHFSDVHAIGKKRGYDAITNHQISFDAYLEQSNSGRQFYSDPLSTSSETYLLTKTCKRMRSENHSNWLDGFMGNVSSISANMSAWAASAAQPTATVSQVARQRQVAEATSIAQPYEQCDYIPSRGIHQPQPLENQMVKGQDLCETHKTSTKYVTDGNSCINTPVEQIQRTPIEVMSSFQSVNQPATTENCHLQTSGETTSTNPTKKPKVRSRPRKEVEPDGKPRARGHPRKQAEPDGKPKARGRARKTSGANGKPEDRDPTTKENVGCEIIPSSLDYLEAIIEKLKLLSINMTSDNTMEEAPKDLGALVPFEGKVKKRGSRAEVKIDPVTNLMWNLLMAPDKSEGVEGMDEDKERFLEEERRVFRGRIDSFIARMHLVQGDRRFSPWKGSVVDSVVGVFLTQNVSDHLSSSAFMALAARFPVKSEGPEKPAAAEKSTPTPPKQKDSCSGVWGESAKLQGNFFVEEIGDMRSLNTVEDGPLDGVLSSQNSVVSPRNFSEYLLNRTYTMGSSSSLVKLTQEVGSSGCHQVNVLPTSDLNKAVPYDLDTTYQICTGLDHGVNISDVVQSEVSLYQQHPIDASINKNKAKVTDYSSGSFLYDNRDGSLSQHMYSSFPFQPSQEAECSATVKQSFFQQFISSEEVPISTGHSFYDNSFASNRTDDPYIEQLDCFNNLQEAYTTRTIQINSERPQSECSQQQDNVIRVQAKTCEKHSSSNLCGNMNSHSDDPPGVASGSIGKSKHTEKRSKARNVRGQTKMKPYDWDNLRKEVLRNHGNRQRSDKAKDAIDWEAVRQANVNEISFVIKEQGMNNMLAERIKDFLNRLMRDHGSIDLERLRDIEPDKAKYPILEHIQKYIWPRLCKLDQLILYELHYQMITFGKVFCSKSKPNCNSCPMRAECKHFASAFASWNTNHPGHVYGDQQQPIIEEPSTPEPEPEIAEAREAKIEDFFGEDPDEIPTINLNVEEFAQNLKSYIQANNIEIEDADMSNALVAISPQAASVPTSKLKNVNRLRTEHQVYELPDSHPLLEGFDQREPDDPSPYLLSVWTPGKIMCSHPTFTLVQVILMIKISTGETAQSTDAPKTFCNYQETDKLCESSACFSCNSTREMQSQRVRGTLLASSFLRVP